jgi:hypothetical protein
MNSNSRKGVIGTPIDLPKGLHFLVGIVFQGFAKTPIGPNSNWKFLY